MEIHKPKPWHNWREFLKEFATIVLGVSVALAAEQGVEWLHWRGEVAQAREVVAAEMAGNVRQAMMRLRTAPCVERRLSELAAILDGADRSGSLPPVGDIAIPSLGGGASGGWESVVASQTATHFPRQELAAINDAYQRVAIIAARLNLEVEAWNSRYAIVGPGRRLDAASETKLRDALSQARAQNRLTVSASNTLLNQVKALNLPFSPEDLNQITEGDTMPFSNAPRTMFGGGVGAVCIPMRAAPPTYGQAMWSDLPATYDEAIKATPHFTVGTQKSTP
jgi:hypothetical protein